MEQPAERLHPMANSLMEHLPCMAIHASPGRRLIVRSRNGYKGGLWEAWPWVICGMEGRVKRYVLRAGIANCSVVYFLKINCLPSRGIHPRTLRLVAAHHPYMVRIPRKVNIIIQMVLSPWWKGRTSGHSIKQITGYYRECAPGLAWEAHKRGAHGLRATASEAPRTRRGLQYSAHGLYVPRSMRPRSQPMHRGL